jgi:hypothetical protein
MIIEKQDLTDDTTPASRGFVARMFFDAGKVTAEVYGAKIKALEARIADLEEQVTRP